MMEHITIASINVRGLKQSPKRLTVFQFIQDNNFDLTLLQETHSAEEEQCEWKANWGAQKHIAFNHGTSRSAGQAILSRRNLCPFSDKCIVPGRLQKIKLNIQNCIVCIYNIYGPNHEDEQLEFYQHLHESLLDDREYDYLIIGGDFNVVQDPLVDKSGGTKNRKKCTKILDSIKNDLNLVDVWRERNNGVKRYTWQQPTPKIKCRLDYFLISKSCETSVLNVEIYPITIKSDHNPISIKISLSPKRIGPSFWKFNASLLQDETYCQEMENLIESKWWEHSPNVAPDVRYDLLKFEVKKFSIKYAKSKAKIRRENEDSLNRQLSEFESIMQTRDLTSEEETNLTNIKNSLESMLEYKARGAWIRSRINVIEKDEKSTKFFYAQEKMSYDKKTIHYIINDNGEKITDEKNKLNEIKAYYEKLYASSYKIIPDFSLLENMDGLSLLSDQSKETCDRDISVIECFEALTCLKNNKSPGCDGLTKEFYVRFWDRLGSKLLLCLNFCKRKGELSNSQKRGVISLLHKKGKDEGYIRNWRPISLLNVDYKILAKVMAKRVEKEVSNLINPDQSGFVRGRYIGQNIRLIQDIIEYTDCNSIPGMLVQLDFEKAYDSIEWEFLFKTLKKFNFGETFISWVKLCYTNIEATVCNSGFTCGWFKLWRGLRQGCPLSCLLFILVAEILAQMIRNNESIEGIQIQNTTLKLSQFADDTTCLLKNWASLIELFRIAIIYKNLSGLNLHEDKTLLIWLGPWRPRNTNPKGLKQGGECFNQLGIHVGRNKSEILLADYNAKLQTMENKFKLWRMRNTSLLGRIHLVKSVGVSNLTYTMSNIDVDDKRLNDAQKILNAFVWNNKPNKVKHSTFISDYDEGGAKMIDLICMKKALRLPWLGRISDSNNTKWSSVIRSYLDKYGGLNFLLRCNFDVKCMSYIPKFYKDMLLFASAVIFENDSKCIIWNNKEILVRGKSIFWKQWFDKGIIFVQDLLHETGRWLSVHEVSDRYEINCNFLQYYGLLAAIQNIKKLVQNQRGVDWTKRPPDIDFSSCIYNTFLGIKINITKAKCKDYYRLFIEFETLPPSVISRWTERGFSEDGFYESMPQAKLSISEPRLLSVQYKINNMIWPVGEKLFKWGLKISDRCFACGHKDDIIHALIECELTKEWILSLYATNSMYESLFKNMSVEEFVFGPKLAAWNHVCITIKWYILYCRVRGKTFHVDVLKTSIFQRIIADKNSMKHSKFLYKWGSVNWLIDECSKYERSLRIAY